MPEIAGEFSEQQFARDEALVVLRRLRESGFEAYFAGGCVRDLLMGQKPKDFDVATSAAPEQVRKLFKNSQAVGAAFGVILVREGKSTIEVATFRTDLEYQDGRHPTGVKFSTAAEDAQRRDFTINGLFLDPIDNRIIDHVGGQEDSQKPGDCGRSVMRMRASGKITCACCGRCDLLRGWGFEIEPATAEAIRSHAHELIRISPERIAEELRKMLMPGTRDRSVSASSAVWFYPDFDAVCGGCRFGKIRSTDEPIP